VSLSVNAGINHCQRTDKASSETAFCESIESLLQTYWGRRINLGTTQKNSCPGKWAPHIHVNCFPMPLDGADSVL